MTGISTLNSRRFPISLSKRPMRTCPRTGSSQRVGAGKRRPLTPPDCSIMAGDRANGRDHLLVGDLVGTAGKARVAPVHEDAAIVFGIASQRGDQLPSFRVVERTEVHGRSPS